MMTLDTLFAMLGLSGGMPRQRSGRYGRPTGSDLRNPADPIQAARIEAAAAKRERKAKRAQFNAEISAVRNYAHSRRAENLNPTYVAK